MNFCNLFKSIDDGKGIERISLINLVIYDWLFTQPIRWLSIWNNVEMIKLSHIKNVHQNEIFFSLSLSYLNPSLCLFVYLPNDKGKFHEFVFLFTLINDEVAHALSLISTLDENGVTN